MWETVRWQLLNCDEIEIAPEYRALAWRELIANVAYNTPLNYTFRTMFQKADFENFDYNTPIVYNVKNKTLIVLNERLKAALNRPVQRNNRTVNVNTAHVFLIFILVVLLTVLVAFWNYPHNVAAQTGTTQAPFGRVR
ncbi:hypothetical protein [Epiphyas postvittana nucleopolyhedrovirus]|uniref:Pif-6 n=1 Tax=Epiphyas postvittana nucleopolyhedrovirus TaxID=70600 RepID=Q91GJ0_NPVEP|nr:hypothetical protein [Epiphyas postvittana nucleopolyhedrovirus]AAK85625.1 unknown [Epiphyas postvittana nucleopolyhedrovirus]